MLFNSRPASWKSGSSRSRRAQSRSARRGTRLFLEQLESRATPSIGLSTLGVFNGANGANPEAGLIMDGSGNLYGTANIGGANGQGTVFELAKGSDTITVLASFNGNAGNPQTGLVIDQSGNLYGTTIDANDPGTIFELAKGSSTITTLASFNGTNGQNPDGSLFMDQSGNLYGTTMYGGPGYTGGLSGIGVIFELAKGSGTITDLASFPDSLADGAYPHGIVMSSSGTLYGTTQAGGADDFGTLFELAKGSSTITTALPFTNLTGTDSFAGLVMDGSGNLYGTTVEGGAGGFGTVFELAKGSSTITILASFDGDGTDGQNPKAALIMDSGGNLYGTAIGGGANNDGTVFELAKGSSTLTTLASFNGSNGSEPLAALIMDSSGNLYGTTEGGGVGLQNDQGGDGSVFELLPHTPALNWSLPAAITYGTALSSTQLDASAADSVTGAAVAGTFVYTPAAGTILHGGTQTLSVTFTPTDTTDYSPITTVVPLLVNQATPVLTWNTPAPMTYGTPLGSTELDASAADPNSESPLSGTFVYTPGTGVIVGRGTSSLSVTFTPTDTIDYSTASASVTLAVGPSLGFSNMGFFNGSNGAYPAAGLIMDTSGNLYGTTAGGGAYGDGTVFEVAAGGTITTLASFNGADGANPEAGLIMDTSGNFYGTTAGGGADSDGTIFELVKGSSTITDLVSFNGSNGSDPVAGLIMDGSGNLYGTTETGGAAGYGTVFEVAAGSGTIATLLSFGYYDQSQPQTGVVMDGSGNLYGVSDFQDDVFEVVKGSGTLTDLASIEGSNGFEPVGGLTIDGSGNLYGTTEAGGTLGYGTVFELAKGSSTITSLVSFNSIDGFDMGSPRRQRGWRADRGQQRQPLWHDRVWRRRQHLPQRYQQLRHGFRAGQGKRHSQHAGVVQ